MTFWEILILVIFTLIGIGLIVYSVYQAEEDAMAAIVGTLVSFMCLLTWIGVLIPKQPKPQAIDVYRGNTTLQITYRDSVAIDTVVVWKPGYEPLKE